MFEYRGKFAAIEWVVPMRDGWTFMLDGAPHVIYVARADCPVEMHAKIDDYCYHMGLNYGLSLGAKNGSHDCEIKA